MTRFYLLATVLMLSSVALAQVSNSNFEDPRDNNAYTITTIGNLKWFQENLRYQTSGSTSVSGSGQGDKYDKCGEFYSIQEALSVCPEGWRLPTEKEVEILVKQHKKGNLDAFQALNILQCGRIDYETLAKQGEQNTFWIDGELKDGFITHWHMFGNEFEIHSHNVTNAKRQFPVRCVCEVEE